MCIDIYCDIRYLSLTDQPNGVKDMQKLTQKELVKLGWQCPECYSAMVFSYTDRFNLKPVRFECQSCGCTWHKER